MHLSTRMWKLDSVIDSKMFVTQSSIVCTSKTLYGQIGTCGWGTTTLTRQSLYFLKNRPPSTGKRRFGLLASCFADVVARLILGVAGTMAAGPRVVAKSTVTLLAPIRYHQKNTCKFRRAGPLPFLCWGALMLVLLSTAICTAADRKQSSWNKNAELKRAGYTELTGRDAVHFLVGNSVLVQKSGPIDSEKNGVEIDEKIYYFLNDHTMYECGVAKESDCSVRSWGLEDNQICLDVASCGEPPKIMKSPRSEDRAKKNDRLGIYLWFDHFAYDIVKGNRTGGPLFDTRISGHPIELDRADIDKEIKDASQYSGGDKQVPISGPRAISLLIGNTFLSDGVAKSSKDQAMNACPKQGTYYSPDGRVIRFTCHGPSDQIWSIFISHWKIESGLFCRDGPMEVGTFGCKPATVSAIFASQESGASDKMLVQDLESGNALTGYAGNALNFRFANRPKLEKSKEN